jgi:cysteine desulfurase/selenocysteine lyase
VSELIGQAQLDVARVRRDFPILAREVHSDVPLVYLDSAATSQKPQRVIDAMGRYYQNQNANIHRGIHKLAEEATAAYEDARSRITQFIAAGSSREIIITKNATEAINLVAYSWGRANLSKGDLILLSDMEHHSNIVPWQMLASQLELQLEYIPLTSDFRLDIAAYQALLERGPKLIGIAHMSNVLGTINPLDEICRAAHDAGAIVIADGAQSVPHIPVDVKALDVDFLAFSGHKMCGPTGVGILYGRERLLEDMPPFLGGGDMIKRVHRHKFTANELPHKFEAGTPPIAEVIGLGEAVDYLNELGMEAVRGHEHVIIEQALERLDEVPGVTVYGPSAEYKGGVAAFTFQGIHPHDVAQILDGDGIAVRAGHHCAMPLHEQLGLPATTRASFYIYNTEDDIERLINGLYKVKEIFG